MNSYKVYNTSNLKYQFGYNHTCFYKLLEHYYYYTCLCLSLYLRSYIGVTVHWLGTNLERHSKALACRRLLGRHTYDNIAEILDKIMNEFNLQNKTTLIVTDNASNFVKAFRY